MAFASRCLLLAAFLFATSSGEGVGDASAAPNSPAFSPPYHFDKPVPVTATRGKIYMLCLWCALRKDTTCSFAHSAHTAQREPARAPVPVDVHVLRAAAAGNTPRANGKRAACRVGPSRGRLACGRRSQLGPLVARVCGPVGATARRNLRSCDQSLPLAGLDAQRVSAGRRGDGLHAGARCGGAPREPPAGGRARVCVFGGAGCAAAVNTLPGIELERAGRMGGTRRQRRSRLEVETRAAAVCISSLSSRYNIIDFSNAVVPSAARRRRAFTRGCRLATAAASATARPSLSAPAATATRDPQTPGGGAAAPPRSPQARTHRRLRTRRPVHQRAGGPGASPR